MRVIFFISIKLHASYLVRNNLPLVVPDFALLILKNGIRARLGAGDYFKKNYHTYEEVSYI